MRKKEIALPEGMAKAVDCAEYGNPHFDYYDAVKAALEWLTDNPIRMPEKAFAEISEVLPPHQFLKTYGWSQISDEIQSRLFVSYEPEAPEAIKDLLHPQACHHSDLNEFIIEAYNRGKNSR